MTESPHTVRWGILATGFIAQSERAHSVRQRPAVQPGDARRDRRRAQGRGRGVVARIVANMDGQLRLKSEEGKGSRFVVQVPFELPSSDALEKLGESNSTVDTTSDATTTLASVTNTLPPTQAGEVMLVDQRSMNAATSSNRSITKSLSFDETNSVNSLKSGGSGGARSNKSDADRLIDAIQTPFVPSEVDEEATNIQRNSKGQQRHLNASTLSLSHSDTSQEATSQSGPGEKHPLLRPSTMNTAQLPNAQPGICPVQDSSAPIRPVKIPDEYIDRLTEPQPGQSSRVLFELPESPTRGTDDIKTNAPLDAKPDELRVLVAEDDPVNMKILTKRLEKAGHTVYPAVNGEDCATVYKERLYQFDIILMDMQMPIVDGLTSTKLIRAFERSATFDHLRRHIPIFAVSASLMEKDRAIYTEAGFDGWILKPIDFKRLHILLDGITSDDVRDQCLYEPGEWERGGWFVHRGAGSLPTLA
ncbi:hypothetical protein O1611_g6887 [Lasiodiplodia mahajangana]|uniref:Uncharacterized protein n=1 Tax=Lasiodiplodia mahajangana TaxID=1108764 RepID=A0ACC2JHA3_9PEZI|nr:hypothetical protein O1611_g6887 [Lasiodiplodia mahajangana]